MKTIELKFANPHNPALGGVELGKETYDQQVLPMIDDRVLEGELTIRFPDNIVIIGNSFVKGFSADLIDKIGIDGVRERVHFVTSRKKLTREMYDGLL
ncbi:hypothetical protein [Fructobacillus papyrifericola]|uniref:DUF4325 domain-containing protein n=1 Tax=Fructobacillus papyrifericola TaxID=2713172 RepID=A0ABS5QUE8_9LACO|nr:hypothetical protein [Fructobacillus papyrifericola]MBS9336816.1 hypothetical protein [Fructobacillus papyrifericola]